MRIVRDVPSLTVFACSKFDDLMEFLDSLVFPGDHTLIHHSGNLLDFFRCLRERVANQIALQKVVKTILDNNCIWILPPELGKLWTSQGLKKRRR